jgi:hypothetical protein
LQEKIKITPELIYPFARIREQLETLYC